MLQPILRIFRRETMPIFEFRCVECGEQFEKLFRNSEEDLVIACPQCKAETCDRVLSRASYVKGGNPEGRKAKVTTKSCGGGNQCMTFDIPGPSK
jgi:putative FmdB family regulatory protein